MCKETKPPTTPPDAAEIPPHWATLIQQQLENRARMKHNVSKLMMGAGVSNDDQIMQYIQSFVNQCNAQGERVRLMVGPQAAFQKMCYGMAGMALVDIVLEMYSDGLRQQAQEEAKVETQSPRDSVDTHDNRLEITDGSDNEPSSRIITE